MCGLLVPQRGGRVPVRAERRDHLGAAAGLFAFEIDLEVDIPLAGILMHFDFPGEGDRASGADTAIAEGEIGDGGATARNVCYR